MFSKKNVRMVLVMVIAASSGILYAQPGDRGRGGPGDRGRGGPSFGARYDSHRSDFHFSLIIAPPRVRPVYISPPHHYYYATSPVVVVAPQPVVVTAPPVVYETPQVVTVPAQTVVVPSTEETVVVWITNDNGSRTPVKLVRLNNPTGYYMGPRGEYYVVLPTDEQLRPLYGLPSTSTISANITVWITNDNGSKTPVTLTPSSGGFVGPSGEFYSSMPSEQQLKAVYGLPSQTSQKDSTVVWVDNAGKKVPIVFVKEGADYVGPNGEHYTAVPGKEQVEAVYGKSSTAAAAATTTSTNNVTVWVESGTSKIPVTLQKQGNLYVGPNGEAYETVPTAEQLKALYAPATDAGSEFGVLITKDDGTQTVLTFKRTSKGFVGPNGETYATMPTEEQLKKLYAK
jgi:hypothetical protein